MYFIFAFQKRMHARLAIVDMPRGVGKRLVFRGVYRKVRRVGFEPTKAYATGSPRSLADSARGEIVTSPLESHVKDISSDSRLFKPFKSLQANQDLNLKP